eukprot:XP_011663273.1 PREDICTED: uncharacterized protein LOC105437867 [Strongylocentrotus purpuratus]
MDTTSSAIQGSGPQDLVIPLYDPKLAALYYVLLMMGPFAVLANGFTYNILRQEKSGFDDVTKQVLKVFTILHAVFGVGEALVSLLQVVPLDRQVKLAVCMYHCPLIYFCFFFTLALTCLLNINRYIIVTRPLRYHLIVTDRRASVILGVAIAESILLTIIMAPIPGMPAEQLQTHMCVQREKEIKGSYYLIFLIAYVVVAVCITIVSTVKLLAISRRQSNAIPAIGEVTSKTPTISGGLKVTDLQSTNTSVIIADCRGRATTTKIQPTRNRRALLTIFLLNVVVLISWMPLIIFYGLAFGGVTVPSILKSSMMILIMSTTWWHCLVYLVTNKAFRETALLILKRFWAKFSF